MMPFLLLYITVMTWCAVTVKQIIGSHIILCVFLIKHRRWFAC